MRTPAGRSSSSSSSARGRSRAGSVARDRDLDEPREARAWSSVDRGRPGRGSPRPRRARRRSPPVVARPRWPRAPARRGGAAPRRSRRRRGSESPAGSSTAVDAEDRPVDDGERPAAATPAGARPTAAAPAPRPKRPARGACGLGRHDGDRRHVGRRDQRARLGIEDVAGRRRRAREHDLARRRTAACAALDPDERDELVEVAALGGLEERGVVDALELARDTAYSRAKLSASVRTMLPGLRSVSRGGACGSRGALVAGVEAACPRSGQVAPAPGRRPAREPAIVAVGDRRRSRCRCGSA